jgi:Flp pilus assembly protein CpaB
MVLIAAIAMGALAAFVLRNYINDQEQKANPNPVEVYVITRDIARGEAFTSANSVGIKKQTMPVKYRPATFVTDLKSLEGKVAATKLAANQVLVDGMFVNSALEATGLKQRLRDGMVAIAMPIEGVRAVGGLLQPGDTVNIMVTPKPTEAAASSSAPAPAAAPKPAGASAVDPELSPYIVGARYLYQQVRILSIGSSVAPNAGEVAVASTASSATLATTGGSIVFEVPADSAQLLASIDPTSLYLTLVKDNWILKPVPALTPEAIKNGAKLPGEDPAKLTPYGPLGYASVASGATAAPTTTKAN